MFALKFVSCGTPPMSPLAFQELTNVFDETIWFLLLGTLTVSILYKKVLVDQHEDRISTTTLGRDILEFFKLLVNHREIYLLQD